MGNHFAQFLDEKKPEIDSLITSYIASIKSNPHIPPSLKEGIIYVAEGEGKRLRPALTLLGWECCQDFFADDPRKNPFHLLAPEMFRRFALAVELIHTYSLVHDDLPAMDNDSLRRGRATCHVRFDEATAILIGDSLLNQASEITLAELSFPSEIGVGETSSVLSGVMRAGKLLFTAAGPEGMIGGQILDMGAERKAVNLEELQQIHSSKTGRLIRASLNLLPAFYGDTSLLHFLGSYAETIGILYQVVDDILDVTATPEEMGKSGTDITNQKTTFIKLLGVEGSKDYARKLSDKAQRSLTELEYHSGTGRLSSLTLKRLNGFSDFILSRVMDQI